MSDKHDEARRIRPTEERRLDARAAHAAHPRAHEEDLAKLPRDTADALNALRRRDGEIARALRDPATASRFYRDPIGTLRSLGVEVPPALSRYAAKVRQPEPKGLSFRLPSGQIVHPHVNVRFTGGRR